jgi:hypothetical protein
MPFIFEKEEYEEEEEEEDAREEHEGTKLARIIARFSLLSFVFLSLARVCVCSRARVQTSLQ